MTTHGSVAKKVRLAKEQHPERYCGYIQCLYRTDAPYCPKHAHPKYHSGPACSTRVTEARIAEESRK